MMKNGKHNLTKKLQFVGETVFMIFFYGIIFIVV